VQRLTVLDSSILREILVDLEKHKQKNGRAWHRLKETFFKKEYYLEFLDEDEAFKAAMHLMKNKKYLKSYRISFEYEKNRLYFIYVPDTPAS
jgi:hypothetical protein